MKRSTTTSTTPNTSTSTSTSLTSSSSSGSRVTRISHLRKGQLQKKSKPNPCVLMTGVITTILMTFIYLVTSSMHRTMLEEHAEYERQRQQQRFQQQQQQSQSQQQHSNQQSNQTLKFVTVVLPSVVNPKGRSKRLQAIADTWGPSSNAIFVTHEDGEYSSSNENSSKNYSTLLNLLEQDELTEMKPKLMIMAKEAKGGLLEEKEQQRDVQEEEEEFTSKTNHNHPSSSSSSKFPQILKVPSSISIDQGVPRLQHVIETISKTYNPDYAFFVNDHTFVIPQHMCTFLAEQEKLHYEQQQHQQQQRNEQKEKEEEEFGDSHNNNNKNESTLSSSSSFHLYAGHALKPKGTDYAFNSGAAGYFLSRQTMHTLIQSSSSSSTTTSTTSTTNNNNNSPNKDCKGESKWLQGNPGLVTANCLKVVNNIDPIDTRDDLGRHLFHAYGIIRTVKGDFDSWYVKKHETLKEIWGEDSKRNKYELTKGKECCSPNTISFHYVEYAETLALHSTFQKIINSGGGGGGAGAESKMSDDELKKYIMSIWPDQKKLIGGYSHNLPPNTHSKKDVWSDLLHIVKLIAPKSLDMQC